MSSATAPKANHSPRGEKSTQLLAKLLHKMKVIRITEITRTHLIIVVHSLRIRIGVVESFCKLVKLVADLFGKWHVWGGGGDGVDPSDFPFNFYNPLLSFHALGILGTCRLLFEKEKECL